MKLWDFIEEGWEGCLKLAADGIGVKAQWKSWNGAEMEHLWGVMKLEVAG